MSGLVAELRSKVRPWDLVALLVVPILLVGVGTLPVELRRAFVFDYRAPTLVTAYTAHFVHLTPSHLLVNVVSYLLIAPIGYALAVVSDRREEYLIGFVASLLALPLVLSYLNLVFVRPRVGYGFSGVAMGLVALLAFELFAYVETRLSRCLSQEDAAVVFFAEIGLMAAVVRPHTTATVAIAVAAFVLAVGYALAIGRVLWAEDRVWTDRVGEAGYVELGAAAVVLLVGFPFVAFPPDPTGDGTVLNLYTHLLGFALAFLAAFIRPVLEDRAGFVPTR